MIEKPKESETVDVIMDDDIDIGVETGYHCCIRDMNNWLKSICENELSSQNIFNIIDHGYDIEASTSNICKEIHNHIKRSLRV